MDFQVIVNNTYIILKRFRFPEGDTTRDAIAVTKPNGLILVSLYTLIVQATITQVWAAVVLLLAAFFMGKRQHSYNRAAATAGIYNASGSQTGVLTLLFSYLRPMKNEIWYPLLWAFLAVLALAGISAASILIPQLLVIGTAAPVNPSAVYFPTQLLNNTAIDLTTTARVASLIVPYYLRSAGQVEVTPRNNIFVEQERDNNPRFVRINYRYNITAADFALQNAAGLILYVEGSCYTEYGWLAGPTIPDVIVDTYNLWDNPSNRVQVSGTTDGGPPFPNFNVNYTTNPGIGNISYAIVPSSLNRYSYTESTDPWYATREVDSNDTNANLFDFIVQSRRPALSCWESSSFNYNNKSVDMYDLHTLGISSFASPDGKQAPFLANVLQYLMGPTFIFNLGTGLGRSGLSSSSSSSLGIAFNAETASIFQDMEYLIMASYIGTRNMFVETTRFPRAGRSGIPDLARSPTNATEIDNSGAPRAGTGDFVVSNEGIMTLSVRSLIAIPLAMIAAVGAVLLLGLLPSPWRVSHALNATILYSYLHERQEEKENGEKADWNREGSVAFSPRNGVAQILPVYREKSVAKSETGKRPGLHWLSRRETMEEVETMQSKRESQTSAMPVTHSKNEAVQVHSVTKGPTS